MFQYIDPYPSPTRKKKALNIPNPHVPFLMPV